MLFSELAPKYFSQGYSCSESIVKAAVDMKIADDSFISIATSFSGGMSSGCLCGAVAASQMVIGLLHGKNKDNTARILAKEFYDRFTKNHKVTCCKVLSAGFEFHSEKRKQNCTNLVEECAKILDELLIKDLQAIIKV